MKLLIPMLCSMLLQAQPVPVPKPPVQVMMDEASFLGGRFKVGPADLLEPLQEMFRKAGFTLVPAKETVPAAALQVRFTVGAIHDKFGRVAYQVFGRLSEGRDAQLKENAPGQPPRIWFASITAARSQFEEGVAEIHATLANIATLLYRMSSKATSRWPADVAFPITYVPPPESSQINLAQVQSVTGLKVKEQGYCPPWPKQAMERRVKGTVRVELIVGEDGKPLRAYVKQGPPEFFLHALQWAMGYEFEPAMADGKAIRSKYVLSLDYQENTFERFNIR